MVLYCDWSYRQAIKVRHDVFYLNFNEEVKSHVKTIFF